MKNLVCAIGLVVLCLLKATLVWSLCCCVGGALAILGTGVLVLAQSRGPGRVNRGCGNKTRNWPQVGFFFSLSARGETSELVCKVFFNSYSPWPAVASG